MKRINVSRELLYRIDKRWLAFVLAYTLLAFFCLKTRDSWSLSSTIWLPSGLVLGALCISEVKKWPAWICTAAFLHLVISLSYGRPLDIAIVFMLADVIILVPIAGLWKYAPLKKLESKFVSIGLLLFAIYFGSIIGSLLVYLILEATGYPNKITHVFTWFISNAAGCLAITPAFISGASRLSNQFKFSNRHNVLTSLAIYVLLFLLVQPYYFVGNNMYHTVIITFSLAITIPLLSSQTIFLQSINFILYSFLLSLASVYGWGPFWHVGDHNEFGTILSQFYLLVVISTSLMLLSINMVRREKLQLLEDRICLLQEVFPESISVFFRINSDLESIYWLSSPEELVGVPEESVATIPLLAARISDCCRDQFLGQIFSNDKIGKHSFKTEIYILTDDLSYHPAMLGFVFNGYERSNTFTIEGILSRKVVN